MNLDAIQHELRSAGLDGWLFFDHHQRDPLAYRVLGLGEFIRHRTGHNIGREIHGAGANLDNYETHDERRIIPWACISIEPGLYFPEFGVRSEVDVFVDEHGARVTGAVQQEIATL